MKQVTIDRTGTRNAIRDVTTQSALWCWSHGYGCNPDCTAAKIYNVVKLDKDGNESPGVVFECVLERGGNIKFEVVE